MIATPAREVIRTIASLLHVHEARVTEATVLADLVTESFMLVEMAIELQDHFGVIFGQRDMIAVKTVGDLAALIGARSREQG